MRKLVVTVIWCLVGVILQASSPARENDRIKIAEGEYILTEEGDLGVGPIETEIFHLQESWTLWRSANGDYEVEGNEPSSRLDSPIKNCPTGPNTLSAATDLLQPYDAGSMRSYPISNRINHTANGDIDCSRPVSINRAQDLLFPTVDEGQP